MYMYISCTVADACMHSYDKPLSYAIVEVPLPVIRDNDVLVRLSWWWVVEEDQEQ